MGKKKKNTKSREEMLKDKQLAKRQKDREKRDKKAKLAEDKLNKKYNKTKAKTADKNKVTFFRRVSEMFSTGSVTTGHNMLMSLTVKIALAILVLGSGYTLSYVTHKQRVKERSLTQTIFNRDLRFSRSETGVMIDQPITTIDHKKAYIPLEVSNMDNFSTNAEDYKIMVQGAGGVMSFEPTGQLIVYGTSGKMVLVIDSPVAIPNEVTRIFIRHNKNLVGSPEVSDKELAKSVRTSEDAINAVKQQYDILDFTVNLGGRSIIVDDSPELQDKPDVGLLYVNFFANRKVEEVNDRLVEIESELETKVIKSDELRKSLEMEGYKVPATPRIVKDGEHSIMRLPVDLEGNVLEGFVTADDRARMAKQVNKDMTNSGSANEDVKSINSLPSDLVNGDGLKTSDPISAIADSGKSPAVYWDNLKSTWSEIERLKYERDVTQALLLYQIQIDYERQVKNATFSKPDEFAILGKIKLPKNSDGKAESDITTDSNGTDNSDENEKTSVNYTVSTSSNDSNNTSKDDTKVSEKTK